MTRQARAKMISRFAGKAALISLCACFALAAEKSLPSDNKFLGVAACARCHREPTAEDKASGVLDWVLLNEYTTWKEHDIHRHAFDVLKDSRSQEMAKALKIEDATKEKSCLACHAIDCTADRREPSFNIENGVSCEACHGASSAWVDPHWKSGWRFRPAAEKEALGMIDVRDPVKKSQLCLSCHLGNVAEGKLVTHAMYAAGHPPLPNFEVQTFCAAEPTHWRTLAEKPREIQQQAGYKPEAMPKTRESLIGGAATFQASLQLMADQANEPTWPELALYDCRGCHHELVTYRARLNPINRHSLGRPTLPDWPQILAGPSPETLSPLLAALDANPFGERQATAQAARAAGQQYDRSLADLATQTFTHADGAKLIHDLCQRGIDKPLNGEEARQLAWFLRIALSEFDLESTAKENAPTLFAELSQYLRLDINRNLSDPPADSSTQLRALTWGIAQSYDAENFKRRLKEIQSLLQASRQ